MVEEFVNKFVWLMFIIVNFCWRCKEFIVLVVIEGKNVDIIFVMIILKNVWYDVLVMKFFKEMDLKLRSYFGYKILVVREVEVWVLYYN